jgi:uncharacterized protein (UPF0332 family)
MARGRLAKAKVQWERACTDSWEPQEPGECITKCFYSYENALTAAVIVVGMEATTKHHEKARLAKELYNNKKLKTDVSATLSHLNTLRKNIQYDELLNEEEVDLEGVTSNLELFLNEVEELIASIDDRT